MTVVGAFLLLVCAVLAAWRRGRWAPRRRLVRLGTARTGRRTGRSRRLDPVRFAAAAAGLAAAFVVGGWWGLGAGVLVGVTTDLTLRRLESSSARRERLRAAGDLPFAVDLIAAALRAGVPPTVAVQAAGSAVNGPLGSRLCRVASALLLGSVPGDAWSPLGDVPGARRVVAAAVRSSESGAALAGALTRLSGELRAARVAACEATAHRAGVLVVLPLGLCFLPAFVLAGLVPIVLSVLSDVVP